MTPPCNEISSRSGYRIPAARVERSDRDRAFQVKNGAAGNRYSVVMQTAPETAAAPRQLPCFEPGLAQPRRPIRDQRAMRRAGHRVLRNTMSRREKARDEIDAVGPRSGRDHGEPVEP